ncbi:MAG: GNAT family N-acetyltransferase [Bacteroidales bacterium]|nr:GNAT family N-acetyltransferase [Bacteroidales bacterium]
MTSNKLQRLIELADKVFGVRNDPDQINAYEEAVRARLLQIHPMTLSQYDVEDGPVAWMLLIPTTKDLMEQFLYLKISERELFEKTPIGSKYDAVYLCSALVLEEYRRKGIASDLVIKAVLEMKKEHPIQALFVWPFTDDGNSTAEKISQTLKMPLYKRIKK